MAFRLNGSAIDAQLNRSKHKVILLEFGFDEEVSYFDFAEIKSTNVRVRSEDLHWQMHRSGLLLRAGGWLLRLRPSGCSGTGASGGLWFPGEQIIVRGHIQRIGYQFQAAINRVRFGKIDSPSQLELILGALRGRERELELAEIQDLLGQGGVELQLAFQRSARDLPLGIIHHQFG